MRSLFLVGALCALFVGVSRVDGAVLGIDIGDEFFKVAAVNPGRPFEIILNVQSNRKTPTAISFHEKTRKFGDDALLHATKAPGKVVLFPKFFLGHNATESDPVHGWPEVLYPYKYKKVDERAVSKFVVDDDKEFYPEELFGHLLRHIKEMAETGLGASVRDVVLNVPCTYTQRQRKAIVDAAEIAGFKVMALVHETSAAAVQQMLDRPADVNETVLFFNLGAKALEVSVAKQYNIPPATKGGKASPVPAVHVLGCTRRENLGGHIADLKLTEKMAAEFQSKHKLDPTGNSRAMKKIEKQAKKTKHVLSANKAADFFVETLMEDTDFKAHVKREELEEYIQKDLLDQLEAPIREVLSQANLTMSDITQVEVLGGGWRMPKVQSTLSEIVKPLELGQHLNGEEAMAMGAALVAANISTQFRLKPILFQDSVPHSITVEIKNAEGVSSAIPPPKPAFQELATVGSRLHGKRILNFNATADVDVTLFESGVPLTKFTLKGIEKAVADFPGLEEPHIQAVFKFENTGILNLEKANAIFWLKPEPEEPEETEEKKPEEGEVAGTSSSAADSDTESDTDAKSEKEEDAQSDTETTDTESEGGESSTSSSEGAEGEGAGAAAEEGKEKEGEGGKEKKEGEDEKEAAEKAKKEKEEKETEKKKAAEKKKKKKEKEFVHLKVDADHFKPRPLTAAEKAIAIAKLQEMEKTDKTHDKSQQMQNTMETFVYATRGKLGEEIFEEVSTEEEREELMTLLGSMEDWLYDEVFDLTAEQIIEAIEAKMEEAQKKFAPLELRAHEKELRPKAAELMEKTETTMQKQLATIRESRQWITEEQLEPLERLLKNVTEWYADVSAKQQQLSDKDPPAFLYSELAGKVSKVVKALEKVLKIQKPKPPKKEKEEKGGGKGKGKDGVDASAEGSTEEKKEGETPEAETGAEGGDEAPSGNESTSDSETETETGGEEETAPSEGEKEKESGEGSHDEL